MGYVLKEGDVEADAKRIDPARSAADQVAAWCGGVVHNSGMADAYLVLLDGTEVHRGEWVMRNLETGEVTKHTDEEMRGLAYLPAKPDPDPLDPPPEEPPPVDPGAPIDQAAAPPPGTVFDPVSGSYVPTQPAP